MLRSANTALTSAVVVVVTVQSIGSLAKAVQPAERPNVVLLMTDDQGYGDLCCHGNAILKTPSLDRLYAESIRLIDFPIYPGAAFQGKSNNGIYGDWVEEVDWSVGHVLNAVRELNLSVLELNSG